MNAATLTAQDARPAARALSPAERHARRRDLVDGFDDPTDEIMAREWDEQTRELADRHRADQLDGNRAAMRGKLK